MQKDAQTTFRLPQEVKLALEEAAAMDMRSVASYLVKVLVEHLSAKGLLAPREAVSARQTRPRKTGRAKRR
jgi:uncharacterized protein (DUF1778 family)